MPQLAISGFYLFQIMLMLGLSPREPSLIIMALIMSFGVVTTLYKNQELNIFNVLSKQVFLFSLLYSAIAWTAVIIVDYYSISYNNFDTGIYANQVSIFSQTFKYYSSILNMPALGEHFTPNLLLVAPLLKIHSSFLWFPVLKLLAFLACPWILLKLGREILGPGSKLIYIAPLIFLSHRYLFSTVAMEFQPSGISLPFILLAFLYAVRQQYLYMILTLILLLGFKEHLALIWVSLGLYALFQLKKTRMGLGLIIAGIALGSFVYFIAMPYFAEGVANSHHSRFAPLQLGQDKTLLLFKAFLSVGFLPLLAPRAIPGIVAAFGIALISNDPQMLTFDFHYQDIGLVVLFIGVIHGLRRIESCFINQSIKICLGIVGIFIVIFNSARPSKIILNDWPSAEEIALVKRLHNLRNHLSTTRPLWTLNAVGPYFFDFPNLRPIIHPEPPFIQQSNPQIIIPTGPSPHPLTETQAENLRILIREKRIREQELSAFF